MSDSYISYLLFYLWMRQENLPQMHIFGFARALSSLNFDSVSLILADFARTHGWEGVTWRGVFHITDH